MLVFPLLAQAALQGTVFEAQLSNVDWILFHVAELPSVLPILNTVLNMLLESSEFKMLWLRLSYNFVLHKLVNIDLLFYFSGKFMWVPVANPILEFALVPSEQLRLWLLLSRVLIHDTLLLYLPRLSKD